VESAHVPIGPVATREPIGLAADAEFGSPVRDRAFALIKVCPLGSYDAAHAATAMLLEAPLLTADVDFGHVPERMLTLITDPQRVPSCRRHRGGAFDPTT
jgi:hypothetical protein